MNPLILIPVFVLGFAVTVSVVVANLPYRRNTMKITGRQLQLMMTAEITRLHNTGASLIVQHDFEELARRLEVFYETGLIITAAYGESTMTDELKALYDRVEALELELAKLAPLTRLLTTVRRIDGMRPASDSGERT